MRFMLAKSDYSNPPPIYLVAPGFE